MQAPVMGSHFTPDGQCSHPSANVGSRSNLKKNNRNESWSERIVNLTFNAVASIANRIVSAIWLFLALAHWEYNYLNIFFVLAKMTKTLPLIQTGWWSITWHSWFELQGLDSAQGSAQRLLIQAFCETHSSWALQLISANCYHNM